MIAVSDDGYLTVVECKLDRNAEVRRTVIGQILSYGAYLRSLTLSEFEAVVAKPYFYGPDGRALGLGGLTLAAGVRLLRDIQRPSSELRKRTTIGTS